MGYRYDLSESRKYWTVIPKGYNKPIRLKSLGEDYTNARILERLKDNRDNHWADIEPFQREVYKPRQYRLQTREKKIKKVGGLYGLYLHYCYKLGYLPKYKKQNNARLHYLLKEDLMKLDQITDEVRLLGKHHIDTAEQLFSYKESVLDEIKTLTDDRTHLRKVMRTKMSDEKLSEVKGEVSEITDKLRTLRKEVRLCDGIAERSKVMEQNLKQIEADEHKFERKENRNYEQRW